MIAYEVSIGIIYWSVLMISCPIPEEAGSIRLVGCCSSVAVSFTGAFPGVGLAETSP